MSFPFKRLLLALALTVFASTAFAAGEPPKAKSPLTIDDVLNLQRIDRATYSPNGNTLAVVVQRPAMEGEVYGRTAYEIDPSRSDVWLVSTRSREVENITEGRTDAAGYWCATWSPNGQRIAMLSTQPENGEPRGGNNVRLYVWDRSRGVARMQDEAVMTQTRYGSPLYQLDLRGGTDGGATAHACQSPNENAPFLWLDNQRLLVVNLPPDDVSGLIDQYGRPFRTAAENANRLHEGRIPTRDGVGSGDENRVTHPQSSLAIVRVIDVQTGKSNTIGQVPAYPFRGGLTLSISPDRKRLAILATTGAVQPEAGKSIPNSWDDAWTVERRLGFANLERGKIRWVNLPDPARFPLELFGWSDDSRWVAVRGRSDTFDSATPLYAVGFNHGQAIRLGKGSVGDVAAGVQTAHPPGALWVSSRTVLARLNDGIENKWNLLGLDGTATKLPGPDVEGFIRTADGRVLTASGDALLSLRLEHHELVPVRRFEGPVSILWSNDISGTGAKLLLGISTADKVTTLRMISLHTGELTPAFSPPRNLLGNLVDVSGATKSLIWSERSQTGLLLMQGTFGKPESEILLKLDTHLSNVDWGRTEIIGYRTGKGESAQAALILPPNYQKGKRYPCIVWVYGGYIVRGADDYWLDPFLPGLYNLQLYAAQGFAVLVPSMPLPPRSQRGDVYASLGDGVFPAIEKMVELGIADSGRIGVMGQSFGGYSVYGLITQTNRFKAAVALAGMTDLRTHYGEFSPLAMGYTGIAHEMSDNWAEMDFWGRQRPPSQDAVGYQTNSPITYVENVQTPLLMIHGDLDVRGSTRQAEQFFYGLYGQGKTSKLLRYGGESHSLAQSPANVRDIFRQAIDWFNKYMK